MAFLRGTFLGATVRSFNSVVGWSGQTSQLTVQLVQDPLNNDVFRPPLPGSPVFFQFYGYTFTGLLQKWSDSKDVNGLPAFTAICIDPREILDGTEVIISAYSGVTGGVPNLINAFGFWENQGFGQSGENDAGMPWPNIAAAVMALTNTPTQSDYGGPLAYQGFQYSLDLSELPPVPQFYRMGGVSVNLLQAITQVCEDGGFEFFVDMVGFTIVVRTISRRLQPPLGTITAFINANQGGIVERSENGLESRNEITSSFLVGGPTTTLNLTDNLTQFWGYDTDGNPITSQTVTIAFQDDDGKTTNTFDCESMVLNASRVADILGKTTYKCTTLEMRLALINRDSWSIYLQTFYPDFSKQIGLTGAFIGQSNPVVGKADMLNDDPANVIGLWNGIVGTDLEVRLQRFYDFVRESAEEYMGRKFLVSLPFILSYQDPETLKIVDSYDVTDSGFLDDESSLGLSELNEDIFKNPDGRYRALVEFTNLTGVDWGGIPENGTATEFDGRGNPTSLFVEVGVDQNIVFNDGVPYALITLPGRISEEATSPVGDDGMLAGMMGGGNGNIVIVPQGQASQVNAPPDLNPIKTLLQNQYISGIALSPNYRLPISAGVPLRSNINTYGPWFVAGTPGKVKFDQDPELTPWNYGGTDTMNEAGFARVLTTVSAMNLAESGMLELAEPPRTSLGNLLQFGGPNITGISCDISTGGFKTTYQFATFTQRFGVFSKSNIERMKRLSLTQQSLRRSTRAALKNQFLSVKVQQTAATARSFMQGAPKYVNRQSPHEVLVSFSQFDPNTSGVRQTMQTATLEEALGLSNAGASPGEFKSTAMMSLNGLFRPFSTAPSTEGIQGWIANYPAASSIAVLGDVPNTFNLDPFKMQNDVEVYANDDTYSGMCGFKRKSGFSNARLLALRGPLVISGWGYGTDTKKWPQNSNGTDWADNYLTRSDKWMVGPADLLWDSGRAVWTGFGFKRGNIYGVIAPQDSGLFISKAGLSLAVWNDFSTSISGDPNVGLAAHCNYDADSNKYYVTAVDCPPSG